MISDETSKRLAKELTERYPATVYGMAKAGSETRTAGSKVTSLKVKKVTNEGCDISLVTCRGDLCEMNSIFYKFNPPLKSSEDLSRRMKEIQSRVLAPKFSWLLTDPLALFILVLCSSLGYATFFMGMDGIVEALANAERLENGVATIFGSTETFGYWVIGGFWVGIIAHAIEAGMLLRLNAHSLRLEVGQSGAWAFLVFLVGFPIFSRFQELVALHELYSSKSK